MNSTTSPYISPLRYPGGKACLTNFIDDLIYLNDLQGCSYFEPYAGGAGAALGLLMAGAVSEIFLNDADIRIYSFWRALLSESRQFIDYIQQTPLTMDEWARQRDICSNPKNHNLFEVGFSTFYMNRCNRSGILTGGPIGGYKQDGKWRIDVRFNRDNLSSRIEILDKLKDSIHITNLDAIDFLKTTLPRGRKRENVFVYLDPPYVVKARKLYLNAYEAKNHVELARYITSQKTLPWMMSYDDCDLIRNLYSDRCTVQKLPIRYSLQIKRSAEELLITPGTIDLPVALRANLNEHSEMRVSNGGTYVN